MTTGAEHPTPVPDQWTRQPSLDEQARAKGTRPIGGGSSHGHEVAFPEPYARLDRLAPVASLLD